MSSPFNEARYKALLEGLEVNEIKKSELERTLRVDAEFYSKANIRILEILERKPIKPLISELDVSDGNHMSISEFFTDNEIPYYRGGDIYNFFIEQTNNPLTIPERVFEWPHMKRSHLKKGDVLVSIVGAIIGNLALVKTNNKATCSCKLAILRPKNTVPEYVAVFLKSKYGQNQIQKFRRGSGQTGLILEDFDQLVIPDFSNLFQHRIKELIDNSYWKIEESIQKYQQAETILLETLDLKDFQPSIDPINIKGFKESFLSTGRLDAEYYQKKYEEVVSQITAQKYDRLANIVSIKKSIEPGSDVYSDEGLPFLRVSDYNKFGINEPEKKLNDRFCKENDELLKKLKPQKETILFSKDGSVGTAYMLRSDADFITSGAILHLKVKNKEKVIPEYLTLVLNSKLVKMQAERDAGGSIILHWRVAEIENVVVPLIDFTKQREIAALVEESFRLKSLSEQLLEAAKRAVELAIEENEEVAFNFLQEIQQV